MASYQTVKKLARAKCKMYSVCMLYNKQAAVEKLKGLKVAACNPTTDVGYQSDPEKVDTTLCHKSILAVSDKMYCNCCECLFEERKHQEDHYKSDWHRYNLRLKLGSFKSVKIEDFEKIANDISSISGSEDDEDNSSNDDSGSQHKVKPILALPSHIRSRSVSGSSDSDTDGLGTRKDRKSSHQLNKIYLKTKNGELISLYKCLLYHKKSRLTEPSELIEEVLKLPERSKSAIFMSAGGHFAAAVFNGNQIIAHKTFHRYVVRAKRGTAQSSRDSQGNAPKSAGASLRRYNEAALMQEIQDWMNAWSEDIKNCHYIFLRAPSFNRKIFYGGKNPAFKKDDTRIRVIPFPTRRPTYNEVRRVHEMLSSIECYGQESELGNVIPISPMRQLSSETGQLEVVSDSDTPKIKADPPTSLRQLKEKPPSSNKESKKDMRQTNPDNVKLSLPDHVLLDDSVSTSSESELVEIETVLTTDHLKEYDCTTGPQRKSQKKKRKPLTKHQVEPDEDIFAEERYHLQNALYTACKTGDTQTLSALLVVFRGTDLTPCVLTPATYIQNTNSNRVTSPDPSRVASPDSSTIADTSEPLSDVTETFKGLSMLKDQEQACSAGNLEDVPNPIIKQESRSSTGTNVPNSLPINKATMRFGGYTLDQLSPLVTVDILNKPFGDNGTTLLHVAAKSNHKKVISMLMKYGADPCARDKSGLSPYNVSDTKDTKNEFRRFMALYPDKYDYGKAKIPGPLSAEKEEERKQRDIERKKIQKKAKAEKLKIQREEDAEKMAEEREKKRFLGLSDREKRLLAAERRLVNQHDREGSDRPVLSRCYSCGIDMTGKVPFEYSDFKFCATKCLRDHRSKHS